MPISSKRNKDENPKKVDRSMLPSEQDRKAVLVRIFKADPNCICVSYGFELLLRYPREKVHSPVSVSSTI